MPPQTRPAVQNGAARGQCPGPGGTTEASKRPTTGLHVWSAATGTAHATIKTAAAMRDRDVRVIRPSSGLASFESPAAHVRRHDAEHDAVGWHRAGSPEPLEAGVPGVEALDERAPFRGIRQELRLAEHGHAALVASARSRFGDYADPGVATQVADLVGALDADHGQAGRVVQE